ncbi:MAG: hypothetical protein A3C79_00245 [Candidatus Taylorbacteria bacterium RIFCSPHIGHO2_02_FULL_45_28]|uniref:Phenylalanine--tRNA ligase beta subunit n=1 Tax=Candidatus Taylorbacteria bacterium RIFCSPHIGHO2_12_FULL_45_16 TaxID=1802315 RepID=A0A1G2MZ29_9BACT|nr:MAG: hypothetical protein A2830_01505 [Candidatus Taylorbacteria bacterium RIFCSPHIGHO2_01_FULL_44_110]OHA25459.1 MAG: hypothetical protein A3C79_00245 [Candidatus Taylorbacteria bacterium RIFCSPHIGHO2_02_FULL_45_28]OHA29127.1 MAG: hypothetical protein A3F51_00715 [Candidatus Taylorbacteria bacterium RIFCSPHIGHO2_12_FULL_45_16]OHA33349.1 MAG: hypothetical protein A3A23_01595 [Candidatus Taylorbacteria bacterium RIFCSPLOWO2_01_FULL_45_59]OHA38739.1 MAG: hypothetical protein A3I98_03510 [Candi
MKISYNWLQTYFEDKLPSAEKLASEITFRACEVESVEKVGDDSVIDINVLPDRAPYALSHRGIAGEVAAIFGLRLKKNKFSGDDILLPKNIDSAKKLDSLKNSRLGQPSIRIDDESLCSRYCARYIGNVKITESPDWLKKPLTVLGQRSINTIVDVTNYSMFDIGQPMHAFDADKIKGTFVLRRARTGERIILLDGKEIILDETMLIEADDDGLLAIAGVKGGKRAEISPETKNVMLVSGNFNPVNIRKTSTKIGIRTDASKRFENGLSIKLQPEAINQATKLILNLSKDVIIGDLADAYPKPILPKSITAKINDIVGVLGIDISDKEIVAILGRLNLEVAQKGNTLTISIPPSRLDIRDWRDIPEEVGRMYGYDKIKANNSVISSLKPKVSKNCYYAEKIKNVLIEAGFSEVYTYSLVAKGVYEIEKPLAADKNHLRTNLADGLTKSLELNAKNAPLLNLDKIKIFEVGRVFTDDGEKISLSIGVSPVKKIKDYSAEQEMKEAVSLISKTFGGVSVELNTNQKLIDGAGVVAEIDLQSLIKDLPIPKSYDDLHFSKAVLIEYKKFSLYPFIVRDIAVFVRGSTPDTEVSKSIKKGIAVAGASDLLARYSLFDTFKKDDKTSYAFRVVFQSMEKTLTDDEANSIMEKIYREMKKNGWEVR